MKTVAEFLSETKIKVSPATFALVGVSHQDWSRLIENPELSPGADAVFMILRDDKEVTLLMQEEDWQRIRYAVRDAKVEREFRLLTLDLDLSWNVVGYLARVTEILAAAEIPVGALSSFSRDHLFIKQQDLGKALRILGEHVSELC
ncbi:MAG: ACT domain-containing protein [Pyrinomonadaceae bacterium]